MVKTLGQAIFDNQLKDGMTLKEIELYNRVLTRLCTVKADFYYGFLHECEKKGIKPTIYRYKKYLKKQEDELADFRKNFKKYREATQSKEEER